MRFGCCYESTVFRRVVLPPTGPFRCVFYGDCRRPYFLAQAPARKSDLGRRWIRRSIAASRISGAAVGAVARQGRLSLRCSSADLGCQFHLASYSRPERSPDVPPCVEKIWIDARAQYECHRSSALCRLGLAEWCRRGRKRRCHQNVGVGWLGSPPRSYHLNRAFEPGSPGRDFPLTRPTILSKRPIASFQPWLRWSTSNAQTPIFSKPSAAWWRTASDTPESYGSNLLRKLIFCPSTLMSLLQSRPCRPVRSLPRFSALSLRFLDVAVRSWPCEKSMVCPRRTSQRVSVSPRPWLRMTS